MCLSLSILAFSGVSLADTTPATTAKSSYDWTGVYVGGFVGGASGANGTNSSTTNTTQFSSPYPQQSNSSNYSTGGSFMGGGTVGYNWQIPQTPYLIGLEGEYGYLSQSGSSQSSSSVGGVSVNTQSKTTIGSDYGYGLVGGRIGYALDRSLFYVKSGAVFTQTNTTNSMSGTGFSGINDAASANSRGTTTGYAIGGGVEYVPTYYNNKNLTVKVEYLYFGIPTSSSSSSQAQGGFCEGSCLINQDTSYHNTTGGISTAKIGVNYKF